MPELLVEHSAAATRPLVAGHDGKILCASVVSLLSLGVLFVVSAISDTGALCGQQGRFFYVYEMADAFVMHKNLQRKEGS